MLWSGKTALDAGRNDFAPIIVPASHAQMMRPLELAAIAALVEGFDLQRVVRAAVTAAVRRCFSLGDSHCGTCSLNSSEILADPGPAPGPREAAVLHTAMRRRRAL
jgi:hypothetical protein